MTSEDIAVIHALSLLREYCVKEKASVDGLTKDLLERHEHPKNMKKDIRTDHDNYEGMSTAYFDIIGHIESQIVETVSDE